MTTRSVLVRCLVCLLAIFGIVNAKTDVTPIQEDTPAKAAQSSSSCFNYNLHVASSNKDYFYTCCDTHGEGTAKIDAKTKLTINNYDCNPIHLNRAEISQESIFACSDQGNAEQLCNQRWGWLSVDDCWVWSACFEAACRPGSSEESFCGDGRCDNAHESFNTCPLDCCPDENPEECIIKNNTCSSPCCAEATCCSGSAIRSAADSTTFWLIVGAVVASVLCIIYCCCCCCCCCCRNLYKSMFPSSKKRRHSVIISGAV